MTVKVRPYDRSKDYELVGDFLTSIYASEHNNWLQPRWEYMHYHPNLDEDNLYKIGVFEDDGRIVGVVHYEDKPELAYFEIHPDYTYLKSDMISYAEKNFFEVTEDGKRQSVVLIKETDKEFESIAELNGYKRDDSSFETTSAYYISYPFPEISVPEGFKLKSLKDEDNLQKLHRVMWRGFNHEGEPPAEGIVWREKMQSAPNLKKELNIVVEAPDGNFASYCGMWYDKTNKVAYVEPVATDPDYRRRGLGKAAVLEGIRRCGELGAVIAYVGSRQQFYTNIGFKQLFRTYVWVKQLY